jgi:hypothetical protein
MMILDRQNMDLIMIMIMMITKMVTARVVLICFNTNSSELKKSINFLLTKSVDEGN